MKTIKRNITNAILFLAVLLSAQTALAFYNPSTGRWLSRDPVGEPGFQILQKASVVSQTGSSSPSGSGRWISRDSIGDKGGFNLYSFVRNDPVNVVDPKGLYSFGESCNTRQRNAIKAAINANCSKAKKCCALSSLGAFSEVVDLLCNHPDDPNPVIDCPDADTTLPGPGGVKCDACARGDTPGNRIWICPKSFDPNQQNPFGCNLGCAIFHEANHNRGLNHGVDMNDFDKCLGCLRE